MDPGSAALRALSGVTIEFRAVCFWVESDLQYQPDLILDEGRACFETLATLAPQHEVLS